MSVLKIYNSSKTNPITLFLFVVGFLFLFFWLAKGMFKLLALAAPILLIAAVILNYRVVVGYGKWLLKTLKQNPVFGVLAIVFSVFGFPFVSAYLFIKALGTRKNKVHFFDKRTKGEYISYDDVDEDFLDLSDVKNQKKNIEEKYNDVL